MRNFLRRLKPYAGLFKWLIALALLGYLFHQNIYQNREVLGRIAGRGVLPVECALAVLLCASAILLTFIRWYLLVWAQEFAFRLRDAFRLGFVGLLLNYAAPGQVGGDVFKAALIAREQQSRRLVAVATVMIDRILGLLALFIVGSVVSLFLPGLLENSVLASIAALLWLGAAAGIVGLLVMLHPATPSSRWLQRLIHLKYVGRAIDELNRAVVLYQTKRKVVVLALVISLLGHLAMLSCFYFAARSLRLGETAPDYRTHLLIIPAAEVGASFVPLPGGVGVLEGAVSYFYGAAEAQDVRRLPGDWSTPPPEWRQSLRAFTANESLWTAGPLRGETLETRAKVATVAATVARGTDDDAARFFSDRGQVPGETARAIYRAGHRELAKAGGLLSALLFRLINLLVAAAGFLCFMGSGRAGASGRDEGRVKKEE